MDNDLTLKAAALKLGFVTEAEFDRVVDPKKMVKAIRGQAAAIDGPTQPEQRPLIRPEAGFEGGSGRFSVPSTGVLTHGSGGVSHEAR